MGIYLLTGAAQILGTVGTPKPCTADLTHATVTVRCIVSEILKVLYESVRVNTDNAIDWQSGTHPLGSASTQRENACIALPVPYIYVLLVLECKDDCIFERLHLR